MDARARQENMHQARKVRPRANCGDRGIRETARVSSHPSSARRRRNCPAARLSSPLHLLLIAALCSCSGGQLAAEPANEEQASSCLFPLIGSLFGRQCQATHTPATAAARYESLKVNQSAAPPDHQQQQQQWSTTAASQVSEAAAPNASASNLPAASANLNVLCNSRCNCVILDLSPLASSSSAPVRLVTPDTAQQRPAVAVAAAAGALDGSSGSGSPSLASAGNSSSGSGSGRPAAGSGSSSSNQANQALIAFNEDYSLDYDADHGAEPQQPPKQPQILSAPASNPSNATIANSNSAEQMRHWQLQHHQQKQQQQQPQESGQTQTLQLSPQPVLMKQQQQHLFPLQHHLQAGSGGTGKQSSAQLYAQSLYSSQAPKLSYHAHAPYNLNKQQQQQPQPQQADLSYLSAASSSSASLQNQQTPGAPPGGAQTNHHLAARNEMFAPLEEPMIDSSSSGRRQIHIKALIQLKALNASDSPTIKQLSSIFVDNNSTTQTTTSTTVRPQRVPESCLDELESKLLSRIEEDQIQSLILSRNEIEFELLAELYALLATQLRKNLYHLDLSHNSISKLGITFTGYLEHHLVGHDNWSSSSSSNSTSSDESVTRTTTTTTTPANRREQQKRQRVNSLFSGGKLYSLMQARFSLSNSTNSSFTTITTRNATNRQVLNNPLLLRALDLSHNKLKWLINDQFKALKHVQSIRLDHNRIRYIHQHAFSGLESLRFLNLNHNRLQVIYIEQFQTNYNLLALMLRSNNLAYLRGGSFASLSQLKRLDLSQNKLTILSNNAFIGLESLEHLNASSNQFVHIPSGSFHPLTSLHKLDLSDNLITKLAPGTFFHLPIEELWLERNDQLVSIERGAFWDLPYLARLHLEANPVLSSINSQSFVSTQALQYIDSANCQSLDSDARQLLENITMSATSRQLRLEQLLGSTSTSTATTTATTTTATTTTAVPVPIVVATTPEPRLTANQTAASQATSITDTQNRTTTAERRIVNQLSGHYRYLYYSAATLTLLLIVALKLVFSYTSTSHYRRQHRVYELTDSSRSDSSSQISSSDGSQSFELFESANNVILSNHSSSSSSAAASEPEQLDISVISVSTPPPPPPASPPITNPSPAICCPDCDLQQQQVEQDQCCSQEGNPEEEQQQQQPSMDSLLQSQLIAAGCFADYGHANCAHFYQSLGPALQLADMTANFVNQLDYY